MSRKTKIKLDRAGMRKMLKEPWVRAALRDEAPPILTEAQRLGNRHRETGDYADAFKVWDATTDRAVVRVGNTDRKALLLEAKFGVLTKAISGKRRAASRERARQRRADRKHNEQVRREEEAAER